MTQFDRLIEKHPGKIFAFLILLAVPVFLVNLGLLPLFADEPTGNLDEENADHIRELLFGMNKEQGTTLVLVTHNLELAQRTRRILRMRGGKLEEEIHQMQSV